LKNYRPDIDGLRALAVLPVLLFHARVPGFSGGFVGVDVFFVISGFLISGIILRGIDQQSYSIARFYERRFRRLLPALFAVLLTTTLLAIPVLAPDQLESHGEQLLATSLFSSNIYYWFSADYFAPGAEDLLLLHTWSLAVEEQFYLVFPLLLLGLGKSRLRTPAVWVLALLSLIGSQLLLPDQRALSFYILPTRAWELLVGTLLALGALPLPTGEGAAKALGALGVGLIGYSVVFYSGGTLFPGLNAAVPVLGTALVLHAGSVTRSGVSGLLSHSAPVLIGKISYSLYLWHWPMLLLASKYIDGGAGPSVLSRALALSLSLPVAYASWRWIENPFRYAKSSRSVVFMGALASSLLLAGLGKLTVDHSTSLSPWTPAALAKLQVKRPPWRCIGAPCPLNRAERKRRRSGRVALWGDSHAHALLPMLRRLNASQGWGGVSYTQVGCLPLIGVDRYPPKEGCTDFNRAALKRILRPDISTVVLAGRWTLSSDGYRPESPSFPIQLQDLRTGDRSSNRAVLAAGLTRTVDHLRQAGKRVVLLGAVPELAWDAPHALGLHTLLDREPPVVLTDDVRQRNAFVDALMTELAEDPGVEFIPLHEYFCGELQCPLESAEGTLYSDSNHLSQAGAFYLLQRLDGQLPLP